MEKILSAICSEIKNYFTYNTTKIVGDFVISDGALVGDYGLLDGQYYRIVGSVFNDGVHKYGEETDVLTDEAYSGAVWPMAVPQEVVDLATDIAAWNTKYGGTDSAAMSPFQSASFGGYSYSKGITGGNGSTSATWKTAFADRLNKWRKIRP